MTGSAPHRQRLPNRRPSETYALDVENHAFTATVGLDPVDGQTREVFLDGAKAAVMGAVQALGYAPATQDEADALGILHSLANGIAHGCEGGGGAISRAPRM